MSNTNKQFRDFNDDLHIKKTKADKLIVSRDNLRKKIRTYFSSNHPHYKPKFFIQGSYKMGTTIRTKDDTCDLDDGVYFESNPDSVTCTTLQTWVRNAVDGTTDNIIHRRKCITVDYKSDYNIDLPVYLFDVTKQTHPFLAIKNGNWREDDPKEMVVFFNNQKDSKGQLSRIVRYLKAWCDNKRENMPSGLTMTILAMNNFQPNDRDDVALKYTLIEIERELKLDFKCIVPATPFDDIFAEYDDTRKNNFMSNLSNLIADAKKAVDEEKNQLKASHLWKKHLGERFPDGENKDEQEVDARSLTSIIKDSKPYYDRRL